MGGGYNFTIVCAPNQPENPKNNTIWINTSTPLGEYQFSATEPTKRADGTALQNGDVWLLLNDTGVTPFNVLKKNSIEVNVVEVSQWNGTTWAGKTAQIYKDGKWNNFGEFLYYLGDEKESVTGGWTSDGYIVHTSITLVNTLKKYDDYMKIAPTTMSARVSAVVGTKNKVDIKDYKTIKVTCIDIADDNKVVEAYSDVSSLSGSYYISVYLDNLGGTVSYNFRVTDNKTVNVGINNGVANAQLIPAHNSTAGIGIKKIQLIR